MKKYVISFLAIITVFILTSWPEGSSISQVAEANSSGKVELIKNTTTNMCMLNQADPVGGERCYQCDESKSSGACKGANRCRGTKSSCKSRGCAFTGGSSSSCTASNYKYCN